MSAGFPARLNPPFSPRTLFTIPLRANPCNTFARWEPDTPSACPISVAENAAPPRTFPWATIHTSEWTARFAASENRTTDFM